MENRMNKSLRIWLLLVILVVVAIFAWLLATSMFWFPPNPYEPWEPRFRPPGNLFLDIELFYTIKAVISTVNVTLLVFLLATYVDIYRKTRSDFTVLLIIFSAVFLLNALASNPFVIRAFGYEPFGLGPFAMLPDLFTLAALSVLLYLSAKY